MLIILLLLVALLWGPIWIETLVRVVLSIRLSFSGRRKSAIVLLLLASTVLLSVAVVAVAVSVFVALVSLVPLGSAVLAIVLTVVLNVLSILAATLAGLTVLDVLNVLGIALTIHVGRRFSLLILTRRIPVHMSIGLLAVHLTIRPVGVTPVVAPSVPTVVSLLVIAASVPTILVATVLVSVATVLVVSSSVVVLAVFTVVINIITGARKVGVCGLRSHLLSFCQLFFDLWWSSEVGSVVVSAAPW